MLQTPVLDRILPDRMYVEVLSTYLRRRISHGKSQFVVNDFPQNLNQAAIFEEDVGSPISHKHNRRVMADLRLAV